MAEPCDDSLDLDRLAALVAEATRDPKFKPWILRSALDGSRTIRLDHARQLSDFCGADLRGLAYDQPIPQPRVPLLQEVLRWPV